MPQSITEKILNEYSSLRSRKAIERNRRMADVHKKYPRLDEIKKEMTSEGMKLAMGVANASESESSLRDKYEKAMSRLTEEKNRIIAENNIRPDYDKIIYSCDVCKDTGFADGEKCKCFLARLTKELYKRSNLSESMKNHTFDDFSLDYYSDVPHGNGISDRMRAEKALRESKLFCKNPAEYEKNILFFGSSGLGKTFLSSCIAHELIEKGYSVVYIRSSRLFSMLEAKKFGKKTDDTMYEILESVYDCDLLVVDDLGTEIPSKYNASFLYDIVNDRILTSKKMILNSNLSMEELSRLYTPRFISRLFESFFALKLTGTDIRRQKQYESEK